MSNLRRTKLARKKRSSQESSVKLALGSRSYEVKIGSGVVDRLGLYLKSFPSKKAFLIFDERMGKESEKVQAILQKSGWEISYLGVQAGESLKNIESLYSVYSALLKARMDRQSTLLALGGGSVGDAAGFVASTYMRGIRWVGLPTTLLAQVDSAIGGKTAVNHPEGKNLIGTYHQPKLVVCETDFLKTLSSRELVSGMGEVIKYGLTFDAKLILKIQKSWNQIMAGDQRILTELIANSAKWKARAVVKDEYDLTGVREVLNFGHTFGHALEKVTDYKEFQHGEAVIWGMRFAGALSVVKKKISKSSWNKADQFLKTLPVPNLPSQVPFDEYLAAMSKDKKASQGKVRFVLLKEIGQVELDRNVTEMHLREAFQLIGKDNV